MVLIQTQATLPRRCECPCPVLWLCKRRCTYNHAALDRGEYSPAVRVYCPTRTYNASRGPKLDWTDSTEGPIGSITHQASRNILAIGSREDVFLVHYLMGNSKASWETKLPVPHPPKIPVPGDVGSVSTTGARSAHSLMRNVVAYVDRGVRCVGVLIPLPAPLTDLVQLLGHGESVHDMASKAEWGATVRLQCSR